MGFIGSRRRDRLEFLIIAAAACWGDLNIADSAGDAIKGSRNCGLSSGALFCTVCF